MVQAVVQDVDLPRGAGHGDESPARVTVDSSNDPPDVTKRGQQLDADGGAIGQPIAISRRLTHERYDTGRVLVRQARLDVLKKHTCLLFVRRGQERSGCVQPLGQRPAGGGVERADRRRIGRDDYHG